MNDHTKREMDTELLAITLGLNGEDIAMNAIVLEDGFLTTGLLHIFDAALQAFALCPEHTYDALKDVINSHTDDVFNVEDTGVRH